MFVNMRCRVHSLYKQRKDIALPRCRSSHREWRNKKLVLTLSATTDEDCHRFQKGQSGRRLLECGELFAKHARKAGGTFNMKRFCDWFSKLLMTSTGLLIGLTLMTSLFQSKTQHLALTEFPTVSADVLGGLGSKFLFHAYQVVLEGNEYS